MSGLVFVCDAMSQPLMPMATAYAQRLLRSGRTVRRPHHAFTVLQPSNDAHGLTKVLRVGRSSGALWQELSR